ncbi:putative smile protein [Penaeus vannamei]|uniref:Putative smile protein n=1 Tax=Penaeus vannamei TaxID=6689 RepID=A0A3R7MGC5_PENVA|nr:putative smile protein [Penaeus vannamei]
MVGDEGYGTGGCVCGWVYGTLVFVVALAVYWNALSCSFVFDDISAIKENRDLRPHTPITNLFLHDFWGTPMQKEQSHKSYRPLCVLTFRLNYLIHGLEPLGYHLVNMLLHGVVCILYYSVARTCDICLPRGRGRMCQDRARPSPPLQDVNHNYPGRAAGPEWNLRKRQRTVCQGGGAQAAVRNADEHVISYYADGVGINPG